MILVDSEINALISLEDMIEDFADLQKQLQPASFDFRLYPEMYIAVPQPDFILDPEKSDLLESGFYKPFPLDEGGGWNLVPGAFCIGSTQEILNLPDNIAAQVDGRSSLGRLGVVVHITAGYADPGFLGRVTLEIKNLSPHTIRFRPGMRIGQFIFMKCNDFADKPYRGHYQHQKGPVLSGFKR